MINIDDRFITEVMPKIGAKGTSVLLAISKHLDVKNSAFPSLRTIRKYTGLGRDAVANEVKNLVEKGYLLKEQRFLNGRKSTNNYTVICKYITVYVKAEKELIEILATENQATENQGYLSINKSSLSINKSKGIVGLSNANPTKAEIPSEYNKDSYADIPSGSADTQTDENIVKKVIDYFNEVTGKGLRSTTKSYKTIINARHNEKYTFENFKKVIDVKFEEWSTDPKMKKYLTPGTLFAQSHFDSYLNQDFAETTSNIISDTELSQSEERSFQIFMERLKEKYPILSGAIFRKAGFLEYLEYYSNDWKKRHWTKKEKLRVFHRICESLCDDKYFSKKNGDFFKNVMETINEQYEAAGYNS